MLVYRNEENEFERWLPKLSGGQILNAEENSTPDHSHGCTFLSRPNLKMKYNLEIILPCQGVAGSFRRSVKTI